MILVKNYCVVNGTKSDKRKLDITLTNEKELEALRKKIEIDEQCYITKQVFLGEPETQKIKNIYFEYLIK